MTDNSDYADLIALFQEFREFLKPKVVNGVPDYTSSSMKEKHRELMKYQERLASIDTTGWPLAQQVDYQVVRAEMNGVDFDHFCGHGHEILDSTILLMVCILV